MDEIGQVHSFQRETGGTENLGAKCGLMGQKRVHRSGSRQTAGCAATSLEKRASDAEKPWGCVVPGFLQRERLFCFVGGGKEPSRGTCGREFSRSRRLG